MTARGGSRQTLAAAASALMWLTPCAARAVMPDEHSVQRAYDEAKNDPDSDRRHVYELQIVTAQCSSIPGPGRYACQIDFVRRAEPNGRLYFEVVTLEGRDSQWRLLSGLCKSKPAAR